MFNYRLMPAVIFFARVYSNTNSETEWVIPRRVRPIHCRHHRQWAARLWRRRRTSSVKRSMSFNANSARLYLSLSVLGLLRFELAFFFFKSFLFEFYRLRSGFEILVVSEEVGFPVLVLATSLPMGFANEVLFDLYVIFLQFDIFSSALLKLIALLC